MKYQNIPTTSKFTVLRQVCNYIPPHLVPKLARETGVEEKTRTFDEWSHTVSLCYAQLSHSIGLNNACDALQLADFLGTSANAVRWQVWTALLAYLLLRYPAFLSDWAHSFSRLFAVVRTALWRKWDLLKLLGRYGTAGGSFRYLARPEKAYFPGFV